MEQVANILGTQNCEHHPYDRGIDEYENQICTKCGKIIATAEEIYEYDDEECFLDEDEEEYWLFI